MLRYPGNVTGKTKKRNDSQTQTMITSHPSDTEWWTYLPSLDCSFKMQDGYIARFRVGRAQEGHDELTEYLE